MSSLNEHKDKDVVMKRLNVVGSQEARHREKEKG